MDFESAQDVVNYCYKSLRQGTVVLVLELRCHVHVPYSLWGGGHAAGQYTQRIMEEVHTLPKAALLWHASTPSHVASLLVPATRAGRPAAAALRGRAELAHQALPLPSQQPVPMPNPPATIDKTLTCRGLQGADHHRHCCAASKNRGRLGSPLGQAIVRPSPLAANTLAYLGGGRRRPEWFLSQALVRMINLGWASVTASYKCLETLSVITLTTRQNWFTYVSLLTLLLQHQNGLPSSSLPFASPGTSPARHRQLNHFGNACKAPSLPLPPSVPHSRRVVCSSAGSATRDTRCCIE